MVRMLDDLDAVEDFRGDFDQLAALMRESWGESANPPYLFTGELLADWFRSPGTGPHLAPSIYHGSELAAFAFGCPRRIVVDGADRHVIVSAFLTVAPAHKASGYGIVVWCALMRRARAAGYDGATNYCVEGEPMGRMIEGSCRLLGLPLTRVKSFSYLVKTPIAPSGRASRSSVSPQQLARAAAALDAERGLLRRWSEPEAEWQLSRLGAVSASDGTAVLTGTVMSVADGAGTRLLVIDDVLWGGAHVADRQRLLTELTDMAARDGAQAAIVPVLGYADLRPFLAAGFVPSPHTLHAYLSLWNGMPPDGPVDRFYLDVI